MANRHRKCPDTNRSETTLITPEGRGFAPASGLSEVRTVIPTTTKIRLPRNEIALTVPIPTTKPSATSSAGGRCGKTAVVERWTSPAPHAPAMNPDSLALSRRSPSPA
jgi:hypothetical protein